MLRATVILAATMWTGAALCQQPPDADLRQQDAAIHSILGDFWGRARDVNGQPIQPSSAKDRETVPISRAAAYRAIEAGRISGLGEWCGLKWEPHYFSLTRVARSMKMIDKQVAFFSVLHGTSQGTFVQARNGVECSSQQRTHAEALIAESIKNGLPVDAAQPWDATR